MGDARAQGRAVACALFKTGLICVENCHETRWPSREDAGRFNLFDIEELAIYMYGVAVADTIDDKTLLGSTFPLVSLRWLTCFPS
jgi:hypothetical protein